jgi:hypothetical protein
MHPSAGRLRKHPKNGRGWLHDDHACFFSEKVEVLSGLRSLIVKFELASRCRQGVPVWHHVIENVRQEAHIPFCLGTLGIEGRYQVVFIGTSGSLEIISTVLTTAAEGKESAQSPGCSPAIRGCMTLYSAAFR